MVQIERNNRPSLRELFYRNITLRASAPSLDRVDGNTIQSVSKSGAGLRRILEPMVMGPNNRDPIKSDS